MPPWKIAECRGFRTLGSRRSMACLPFLPQNLDDKCGGTPMLIATPYFRSVADSHRISSHR